MHNNDIIHIESTISMPLMPLPVRGTAVRVNGGVVLFSPPPGVDLTPVKELGEVTDIVAPTVFHHLGMKGAAAAFPGAKC